MTVFMILLNICHTMTLLSRVLSLIPNLTFTFSSNHAHAYPITIFALTVAPLSLSALNPVVIISISLSIFVTMKRFVEVVA